MRVLHLLIATAAASLISGCRTPSASSSGAGLPISYSPVSPESLEHLSIRRITLDASTEARIGALVRTNSPWGSRWITCEQANTMHDGPWTTRLYIFARNDSRRCIEVEARDHANGGVNFEWLNDRALFIRCWRGRIVSTDFVLDTDTSRLVYIQDAHYL
jgi:hypothetical protein